MAPGRETGWYSDTCMARCIRAEAAEDWVAVVEDWAAEVEEPRLKG
jgi:hypothetical protein